MNTGSGIPPLDAKKAKHGEVVVGTVMSQARSEALGGGGLVGVRFHRKKKKFVFWNDDK